jgi:hypothetical protein
MGTELSLTSENGIGAEFTPGTPTAEISIDLESPPGHYPDGGAAQINEFDATAGEDLSALKVVALINERVYRVSSSDLTKKNMACGITSSSAYQGRKVFVATAGVLYDATFNWDVTKMIYVGEFGNLTQTPPAVGFCQVVGTPVTSKGIKINMQQSVERN